MNPNWRLRPVAEEYRQQNDDELFVATPIEAFRAAV